MRRPPVRVPRSARRSHVTLALVLSLMPVAVRALAAQSDRWDRQVEAGLARSTRLLRERGYAAAGRQFRGLLNTEESDRLEVPVARGEYVIVGTCDDDCTGLHLVVSNPTGYEIDAARGPGNAPIITIRPPALTGAYLVTVTMAGCRVSPCRYGIMVYQRPDGAEKAGKAE